MIRYFKSSIGKKQMVAVSGIALVLFLIAHVLGNLNMFIGPKAMNDYAYMLHNLGGGTIVWIARAGLLTMFLLHFGLVINLIIMNKRARAQSYAMPLHKKTRSIFTKFMRFSGLVLFLYIIFHLIDYTFTPHTDLNSTVRGEYMGLYGHVYNSFLNPLRSIWYIFSMCAVGMHLIHGIESVVQTFGFRHPVYTPLISKLSWLIAGIIVIGFSSVPIFVNLHHINNWSL